MTSSQKVLRRKNRSWNPIITEALAKIEEMNAGGMKPTLRTIHYFLYSRGMIRNTKSDYGTLSSKLVQARLEGLLSWDALADNVRDTINIPDAHIPPERHLARGTDWVRRASETFKLPRWYNQPHYVEFWVEKDAMASTLQSILKDKEVAISINRGNDGWTHFYESARRIMTKLKEGKKVHVFYLGDYDPSGKVMVYSETSRHPHRLATEQDHSEFIGFLGAIRQKLKDIVVSTHSDIVPPLTEWQIVSSDLNLDLTTSSAMHLSNNRLQVKHYDHLFRIYVKSLGSRTVRRIEKAEQPNRPALDYLQERFTVEGMNNRMNNFESQLLGLADELAKLKVVMEVQA